MSGSTPSGLAAKVRPSKVRTVTAVAPASAWADVSTRSLFTATPESDVVVSPTLLCTVTMLGVTLWYTRTADAVVEHLVRRAHHRRADR